MSKLESTPSKSAADEKFDALFGNVDSAIAEMQKPKAQTAPADKTHEVKPVPKQRAYTLEQALAGGPRKRFTK